MKRITVMITDPQDAFIRHAAEVCDLPYADVLRRLLGHGISAVRIVAGGEGAEATWCPIPPDWPEETT